MRADREPKRPVADFMRTVRDQPNIGFAVGVGALVVVVAIVFAVTKLGGTSHHAASDPGAGNVPTATVPDGATPTTVRHGSTTTIKGAKTSTTASGTHGSTGDSTPSTIGIGSRVSIATIPPRTIPPVDNTPSPLPASEQRWFSTPASVTVHAGGYTNGFVIVENLSSNNGTVQSPGCSSGPTPMSVRPAAATGGCNPTTRTVSVHAHKTKRFEWTWHATGTGRGGSPPLAPGNYGFTVGPVTVRVTVTAA